MKLKPASPSSARPADGLRHKPTISPASASLSTACRAHWMQQSNRLPGSSRQRQNLFTTPRAGRVTAERVAAFQ